MQGIQGEQGTKGDQGDTGIQGVTGLIGSTGFVGSTGIQGDTGIIGDTGIQGVTGSCGYIQCFDLNNIVAPSTTHIANHNQGNHATILALNPTNFIADGGTSEYTTVQYAAEYQFNVSENNFVETTAGDGIFSVYEFDICNEKRCC